MLVDCYGYRCFAVAVLDSDGNVAGGLPVVELHGLRRARRWVALPFSDICPPLLGSQLDAAAFTQGLEQAREAAQVESLEVRSALAGAETHQHSDAVIHTTTLCDDPDALFATFHRSQVQRNLRRSERENLVIRCGTRADDLTRSFYRLHVHTRQRLGMPVQPRRFFAALWDHLLKPGYGRLMLVYTGSQPIAGAVFLTGSQTVTYKYGASDSSFWRLRPNHLLFANALRWTCAAGYRQFDWGRTDLLDRGLREFKSGWAAVEEPLVHTVFANHVPANNSGRTRSAARVLLRHSPAWVCRVTGELFYRYAA